MRSAEGGATTTTVATANVLNRLGSADASAALRAVLATGPDLVGLQEWSLARARLLRGSGGVRLVPSRALGRQRGTYTWLVPVLGGCPVGVRADRYDVLGARSEALGSWRVTEPGSRPLRVMPPRPATVAVLRDRWRDRVVSLVCYHLSPGVQARGRYREDRPRLAEGHRREVHDLRRVVAAELALGRVVHAAGDSNFDGLRLDGLTSAWAGREHDPGTLGPRRHVDDVLGPGPADRVTTVATASDHLAVVARRYDA